MVPHMTPPTKFAILSLANTNDDAGRLTLARWLADNGAPVAAARILWWLALRRQIPPADVWEVDPLTLAPLRSNQREPASVTPGPLAPSASQLPVWLGWLAGHEIVRRVHLAGLPLTGAGRALLAGLASQATAAEMRAYGLTQPASGGSDGSEPANGSEPVDLYVDISAEQSCDDLPISRTLRTVAHAVPEMDRAEALALVRQIVTQTVTAIREQATAAPPEMLAG